MTAAPGLLPFLRLVQAVDSGFPTGGYAFSHGLEWLHHAGLLAGEVAVASALDGYLDQVIAGQAFPAAMGAARARSERALCRWDTVLDASIAAEAERNGGRAMGERLLVGALDAFGGARTAAFLDGIRSGRSPGQYAIAFGVVAADAAVPEDLMLAGLGMAMSAAMAQVAVRLGAIGQAAGTRVVAAVAPAVEARVQQALAREPRPPGAWLPGLELAALLQPAMHYRMFAS
ncbi:MAG: urease accessory protein UreF [Dehalococcoidia bacterium]